MKYEYITAKSSKKLIYIVFFLFTVSLIPIKCQSQDEVTSGMYGSLGLGYLQNNATVHFDMGAKINHISIVFAPIVVLNSGYIDKPYVISNINLGYYFGEYVRVFGSYGWHAQGKQALIDDPNTSRGYKYGYGLTLYKKMNWSRGFTPVYAFLTLEKTGKYLIPSIGFSKIL